MKAWNIKQLADAMRTDMEAAHGPFERQMVKAICGREIRERAHEIASTRKLTPPEV